MAWNESGGDDKDPWGNRGNQGHQILMRRFASCSRNCQDYSVVRDPLAAVLKGRLRA